MRIDVVTLFPEVCEPFFASSILGRAQASGLATVRCHNIRDYADGPHRKVDDRPFGGGPGMVMMCEPVFAAVEAICRQGEAVGGEETESEEVTLTPPLSLRGRGSEKAEGGGNKPTLVLLTPQGERLNQSIVRELAACPWLVIVAGHYEGFDERIHEGLSPREISIGDYVLSGGEAAAMVLVDAVVRLVPGVLGDAESPIEESFSPGLLGEAAVEEDRAAREVIAGAGGGLEYPQYTRPREFRGMSVPEILLSGDHARIRAWRRQQALERTRRKRPDLLRGMDLGDEE